MSEIPVSEKMLEAGRNAPRGNLSWETVSMDGLTNTALTNLYRAMRTVELVDAAYAAKESSSAKPRDIYMRSQWVGKSGDVWTGEIRWVEDERYRPDRRGSATVQQAFNATCQLSRDRRHKASPIYRDRRKAKAQNG